MNTIDKTAYLILVIIYGVGLYIGFSHPDYFNDVFAAEDGLIEYATALLLFLVSILCCYRIIRFWNTKPWLWKCGVLGFALIFFFGAGEEISWGQRLFHIESGEFFIANNAQRETNLHNLVVNGKKLNKIIFSQLLTGIMILYLYLIPIIYRRFNTFKKLVNFFAIPIVKWHHTIAFTITTLFVILLPPDRKWELYEFTFGVLFFLIFLYPLNEYIYRRA